MYGDNKAHEAGDKPSWWGLGEKRGEGSQGCSNTLKWRRMLTKELSLEARNLIDE